jgi:hypothetical protein
VADFNKPVKTDSHANVWDYAKARAEDIATWFDSRRAAATNISEHTKRWNDTAKCWERWNGSAWVADVTLGIAGGGTGTTTAAGIRSAINVEDGADVTDAGNVGSVIHAAAAKTTPVDADEAPLIDSAASNVIKKVTWTNIKATLKTYFDTLYAATAKGVTNGDSHDHNGGDGAAIVEAAITLADNTTDNVSTSKHGFAPKSPNDGTKFLDGLGAYDTVKDSDLATTDITTNNVTTAKHGFVPKAPNDTTKYLCGDANWVAPAVARAWVNFNGTGTVAIRAGGNVTSITDNGTGDYTITFTADMADINYAYTISAAPEYGASWLYTNINVTTVNATERAPLVGSCRIQLFSSTGAVKDSKYVNMLVFR